MDTISRRESAKIYEFPQRNPKVAAGGQRRNDTPVVDLGAHRLLDIQYDSGWYHQAAIQEAERLGKP